MKRAFLHLWILIQGVLAALGGATLALGVLNLSLLLTAFIALSFALAVGLLWYWALRSPTRIFMLGALILALLLLLAVTSLNQLRGAGQILVNTVDRQQNFAQLCAVLQDHYPYFNLKNVDWGETCRRYQPLVRASQTDAEYHTLIATLLAELGDAHTNLLHPRPTTNYFGWARQLSDGVVLVEPGQAARQSGVERGAEILAVNGLPTAEALLALPLPLRFGSTPWQSRAWAASNLLSTPDETLTLTYRNPDGNVNTVILTWVEKAMSSPVIETPLITSEILPTNWGRIRLSTFSRNTGHDLVAEFDRALEHVRSAPALILDLRGNGGGDSRLAEQIAGRFFNEPFCYGYDRFRQRLPQRGWSLRFGYCIQPRGETISTPLILLIDSQNMSSAEQFIAIFTESKRAITIGERTAGASGNPLIFPLTGGGRIRFSTGAFFTRSGQLIEGNGIQPDIPIAYTVADFQSRRDPILQAAQNLDLMQRSPSQNPCPRKESTMLYVKLFGYFLASAALATSIAIALMGARWQAVERSAYAGKRRPWWFVLISILLIGFYLVSLVAFINTPEKTWAGWVLMVILPIGWGLKALLVIFNPKGRTAVSAIEGDQSWRQVAFARLPIAILLGILTWFA